MRALEQLKGVALAFGLLAVSMMAGCTTDAVTEDTTNTVVSVVSILPAGQTSTDMQSDVCSNSGDPPPGCTATPETATATLLATPKQIVSSLGSGPYNDVVFTRYRVTYRRADGRNTPGVDVPYAFDGASNFMVVVGQTTSIEFTVVRPQAKLEPPLANLAFNGGSVVISAVAEIEFIGADVAGRAITVKGYLNITFGDFPVSNPI